MMGFLIMVAVQVYLTWRAGCPERMGRWERLIVGIIGVGGWVFVFAMLAFYRPEAGWVCRP